MPPTVPSLALISAVLSAAATIFIRQGLRGGGAYAGFWINVAVGAVGLWTAVLFTGGLGRTTTKGIVFFVLAGDLPRIDLFDELPVCRRARGSERVDDVLAQPPVSSRTATRRTAGPLCSGAGTPCSPPSTEARRAARHGRG